MKPFLSLLPLLYSACGTAIVETKSIEENVETVESTEESPSENNNSNDADEPTDPTDSTDANDEFDTDLSDSTDDDTEQPSETGTFTLESDAWFVTDATMLEDSCNWDAPLRDFFGIGSDALLPSDFTVEGYDGYFSIQANDYGAASPIDCTLSGSNFECERQTVSPLDFDLGSYGWTYAIDFTGTTLSSSELIGVAEVYFPTISDWLVPVFQSMGVDYTQCVQRFELSIVVD